MTDSIDDRLDGSRYMLTENEKFVASLSVIPQIKKLHHLEYTLCSYTLN